MLFLQQGAVYGKGGVLVLLFLQATPLGAGALPEFIEAALQGFALDSNELREYSHRCAAREVGGRGRGRWQVPGALGGGGERAAAGVAALTPSPS